MSFTLQAHVVSAAPVNGMTTTGALKFSFPVLAYPCPLSCVGPVSGTFEGTVSGLDVNNHPFVARFVAAGINMTGGAGNSQACTGDPIGELLGIGSMQATVTGGTLIDNGVSSTGASLSLAIYWSQFGTAVVLLPADLILKNGSGGTVQSGFISGKGVGTLVPIWTPFRVPLSCFDQFPATVVVAGTFAAPI